MFFCFLKLAGDDSSIDSQPDTGNLILSRDFHVIIMIRNTVKTQEAYIHFFTVARAKRNRENYIRKI